MSQQVVEGYRLSPQQRRLFALHPEAEKQRLYGRMRLTGEIDSRLLSKAFEQAITRHESLRTSFHALPGMELPLQVINKQSGFRLEQISAPPHGEQKKVREWAAREWEQWCREQGEAESLRVRVLHVGAREQELLLSVLELCADRRALENLVREVARGYEKLLGSEVTAEDEPMQYADFSEWQNELLESAEGAEGRAYWQAGDLGAGRAGIRLPLEREVRDGALRKLERERIKIGAEIVNGLEKMISDQESSMEELLLGSWYLLLWRLTNEAHLRIETAFTGRKLEPFVEAIGNYGSCLPIRLEMGADYRVGELLEMLGSSLREARGRQEYYNWEEHCATAGAAMERIGFSYSEQPVNELESELEWQWEEVSAPGEGWKLELRCERQGSGLLVEVWYEGGRYGVVEMQWLLKRYERVLAGITKGAESLVAEVEIVSEEELEQQLVGWNQTAREYASESCLQQLFEAQVERTPEAVAVVYEAEQLTYAELNARANQLAHYLRELGVGPEVLVGLCVERSLEMLVGVLGILKAGGAYVPLDPSNPLERLSLMLADAGVTVLVTQQHLLAVLPEQAGQIVCVDGDRPVISEQSEANPACQTTGENLCYVIYTSGSTGKPKGVLIPHRNLAHLSVALREAVYSHERGPLQVSVNAPIFFDGSVKQLIQLLEGHTLHLLSEEVRRDPRLLQDYIMREKLEVLDCTPGQLRQLLQERSEEREQAGEKSWLKVVLVGGEAIGEELWEQLAEDENCSYYNVYGPTECTVDATVGRVRSGERVSIGRAVANTEVYVLDKGQEVVPVGVVGELYLGGAGLARGYLNQPEQTAEKFVKHPFSVEGEARLYRTGDLVRYLSDGRLEFVGRLDHQVKVRGYRIELGEIEAVLSRHSGVQECVVVAREEESGDKRLVAYVVPTSDVAFTPSELRSYLQEKLPEYMVPAAFVELGELPLTRNGKVDRQALPAPEQMQAASEEQYVAPRNAVEELIAGIWSEVLKVERVSSTDNFFELGGHSLLATQVISRVREVCGTEVGLRHLFERPRLGEFAGSVAEVMRAGAGVAVPALERVSREGELPLSFAQQRLWFIDQLEPGSHSYNIPAAVRLSGELNVMALEQTLSEIVKRHESLRTSFRVVGSEPVQVIAPVTAMLLPVTDLSLLVDDEREEEARRLAGEEAREPFDLSSGPLFRAQLLRLSETEHILLCTMHHVVSDGWSMGVLIREVAALYQAFSAGAPSPLPELSIQYADFAAWQREWLTGEVLDSQLSYWKQQLQGAPAMLELPTDRPRPAVRSYRGARHSFQLSAELSAGLKELSRREGATLFMVLLAAFDVLLSRYTGQDDIVVGTDIANRNRTETEQLIGFFINQLVMRTDVSGNPTFRELLGRVREVSLGAYAHQDIPFEKLVEELRPERDLSRSPLFQTKFVLQNVPREAVAIGELNAKNFEADTETARFDLLLTMFERDGELTGIWSYSSDILDEATVKRLSEHFLVLLGMVIADPEQRVAWLALMTEAEERRILVEWNDTEKDYRSEKCIQELFEEHVEQRPKTLALIHGDKEYTYAELNARANRLAHYLRQLGVGPEVVVGICLEHAPDMVIGLLAILKSGGAYLPLDLKFPLERLAFMLEDGVVPVLLTEEHLIERLPAHRGHTVCLDTDWATIAGESEENLQVETTPDNAAYVIYTSGSTGQPKGVVVRHGGVINLANWQADNFKLTYESRIAQCFSYSFDGAVGETFMGLLNGATLVQLSLSSLTPERLVEEINRHKVTVAVFVPALLAQMDPKLLLGGESLTIVSVGEACPVELALRWSRNCNFMNAYGPTEYTVYSHLWRVDAAKVREINCVPIGTPIHNTRTYILDRHNNPAPVGVPGEIYIGGAGMSRGYLNQPQKSAARFVPNRFVLNGEMHDCGPQLMTSALEDIRAFEEGRGKAIAAHPKENGNGDSKRISTETVMRMTGGLAPELIEQTRQIVESYHIDSMGYEGFCRYLFEGANNTYGAQGINEEVLRFLLPFEEFDCLKGLDLCFGNAEIMQTLSRMGAQMTGLDLSPFFVQKAKEFGLDVRMARVDVPVKDFVLESGIQEGSYDFALTTLSLDRVGRPREFLENLFFSLKDGGRFAIQTLLPIIPVDDGDMHPPLVYTLEQNRITAGKTIEEDKLAFVSLLHELGASDVSVCELPYIVTSRDGVQHYFLWSFFGRRKMRQQTAVRQDIYRTLYKTGDLACYLPGGEIKYLGRIDDQVKLRGFRIELGEIEAVLHQHPQIKESVVTVTENERGEKRLLAYVVAAHAVSITNSELRAYLQGKLPEYMLPSVFVQLSELPLTPNGKVDRRALPMPEEKPDFEAEMSPRTPTEELLAGVWGEILGHNQVGIHSNFFELGGHSLLATQVISRIREVCGVELSLRIVFESPTVARLAEQIEAVLRADQGLHVPAIVRRSGDVPPPLSFAQQRLWFIDQLEPGSHTYNIPAAVRLSGELNAMALEQTLSEIVSRHESLRTSFRVVGSEPVQVIAPAGSTPLLVTDLSVLADTEREEEARRLAAEEARAPFDLSTGPLFRAQLLRLSDSEHILLCTMHHVVSDGWSMGVLIREVAALYQAYSAGEPSPLKELTIQYADFAAWQREWLTGEVLESQLSYWKQQLQGAPAVLELPTDRPRPAVRSYRGARHSFQLSAELSAGLKELSRREGATLFMVLLAAFDVLLSRYTGQDDIVVGTDIANRNRTETEQLIGFFINQLVMRTDVSGNPTFRELLGRVREVSLGAYAHQDIPFEKLVEELRSERDLSRSPLFQTKIILQNAPRETLRLPALQFSEMPGISSTALLDLTLLLREEGGRLAGTWSYSTEIFEAATMERMAEHFQQLLAAVVAEPEAAVCSVALLTEAEREQQLVEWNQTREYASESCIQQLFEAQVERTPEALAVVYEAEQLTYEELNERANQLAHYLRALGVGPEVLVGICVERSLEMVVGVLGILKAGGAYVPLDAEYPLERLSFMLEDAGVGVLLTQARLEEKLPAQAGQVVCLDSEWEQIAAQSTANPECLTTAENLCYVIYTSGSTGRPKGVEIEQRGLVNYVNWSAATYPFGAKGRTPVHSSLSFDLTVTSLYVALVRGGCLELIAEPRFGLSAALEQGAEFNVLKLTPGQLQLLNLAVKPAAAGRVKALVLGGENLLRETVTKWLELNPGSRVFNEYGPTETVVGCCIYEFKEGEEAAASVPIGGAIANSESYLLDERGALLPVGASGELYIGGAGVGRGYLHRPDLTAERFVPHPYSTRGGERLYRTGDVGRYRPTGTLEYLGRLDQQVKVRGYRVELGEIEAVLSRHSGVQECVVVAREEESGDKRLVAYVVPTSDVAFTPSELRSYLQEKLPEYMVPAAFVELGELPLTRNGKVDRQALPAPEQMQAASEEQYVAPRNAVEELIAGIWSEVLKVERVGRTDNFFELGGHSLLATQVISRVREVCGTEVGLRHLFERPRLGEFAGSVAEVMRAGAGVAVPVLERVSREGELPLSFAQQRLWFIDQLEPGSHSYNIPAAVRLSGELNVMALEQTLSEIVSRHESLRTSFTVVGSEPVQMIAPVAAMLLPITDLSVLADTEREEEARRLATEEARAPFDLSTGPLFRAQLLRLSDSEHILLCTMHHVVSDGWSMGVLIREVAALYQAFSAGEPSPLKELTIQYADFAAWQREWLTGEVLESQLSYWKQQLQGAPAVLELPTDRPRPAVRSYRGARHSFQLSAELSAGLKELSRREGATLFMVLLAAFDVLLSRYTGQDDIVVGTDIANRNRTETEQLIGFFINQLVMRTDVSGNPTFRELLGRVREVSLGAYAHQDIPFEKLVEELRPERDLSRSPLFQVTFVLQNMPSQTLELGDLNVGLIGPHEETVKFDLTLIMKDEAQGLSGAWAYATEVFNVQTIARMHERFEALLNSITKRSEARIKTLDMRPEFEKVQEMLRELDLASHHHKKFMSAKPKPVRMF